MRLRLKRVGWIFSVSSQQPRDFPLSEKEVRAMAALQAEAPDEFFVTVRAGGTLPNSQCARQRFAVALHHTVWCEKL